MCYLFTLKWLFGTSIITSIKVCGEEGHCLRSPGHQHRVVIGTLTELLVPYQRAECPVVDTSVLSLSPGLPSCLTVSQTDSKASRQQLHVVHSNQLSEETSSSQQDPLVRLTTVVTVLAWWSHRGSATIDVSHINPPL